MSGLNNNDLFPLLFLSSVPLNEIGGSIKIFIPFGYATFSAQ
jgi:hypothetical protein